MPTPPPLRISLVDMNNGVVNQATRCFRRIVDAFQKRVRAANPGVEVTFRHLQPRNLGEIPDLDVDLVLSSGGPGAPQDGFDDTWGVGYRAFLDRLVEENQARPAAAPKALLVCHSFELAVLHFKVAQMNQRASTKFGVMPAYITEDGQDEDFLRPFGYRLFTWEHRNWEAIHPDEKVLADLGGRILAREAHRRSVVNRGKAILGIKFTSGVDGLQFHPEADKPGVLAWIQKPEHAASVQDVYGEVLYERMISSLENPERLARTFALCIPGWLAGRFNELAPSRGWHPVEQPDFDMQEFDVAV